MVVRQNPPDRVALGSYTLENAKSHIFPTSSAVERHSVKVDVPGSSPGLGAKFIKFIAVYIKLSKR